MDDSSEARYEWTDDDTERERREAACVFPRCVDGEKPSHCGNCEGRETPYAHEYDRSAATTVAALYVQKGGAYFGLPVIGGGINSGECVGRRKIEKREASATPTALRDVLLDLARSARMEAVA